MTKPTTLTDPKIIIGFLVWSVAVFAAAYMTGAAHEKQMFAAKNKPLTAPAAAKVEPMDLVKAGKLAQDGKYDEAIAMLSPQVAKSTYPSSQRVQGMIMIGQYYQAKSEPEPALKWYLDANKLAGSPNIQATLGAASASAQLYGAKTAASGAQSAQSYKTAAIDYYKQALPLTNDESIKKQINTQIATLSKAL